MKASPRNVCRRNVSMIPVSMSAGIHTASVSTAKAAMTTANTRSVVTPRRIDVLSNGRTGWVPGTPGTRRPAYCEAFSRISSSSTTTVSMNAVSASPLMICTPAKAFLMN